MLRKDILRWLVALPTVTVAIEAGNDTIPSNCKSICASTFSILRACEKRFEGNCDKMNCIRAAPNASTSITRCEACTNQLLNNTKSALDPVAEESTSEAESKPESEAGSESESGSSSDSSSESSSESSGSGSGSESGSEENSNAGDLGPDSNTKDGSDSGTSKPDLEPDGSGKSTVIIPMSRLRKLTTTDGTETALTSSALPNVNGTATETTSVVVSTSTPTVSFSISSAAGTITTLTISTSAVAVGGETNTGSGFDISPSPAADAATAGATKLPIQQAANPSTASASGVTAVLLASCLVGAAAILF